MGFETIALLVCVPLLAFFVAKWLFQKDTEKEQRRLQAAAGASELKAWGLEWAPKLLNCYAVGDYSGLLYEVKQMLDLFVGKDGNKHIMDELEGTFKRVLEIKLATVEGRASITDLLAQPTIAA